MPQQTLILGYGTTGKSYVNYLLSLGKRIKIFDTRTLDVPDNVMKNKRIQFFQKKVPKDILDNINQVLVSPGFDPRHPLIKKIRDESIELLTDIDIFKKNISSKIISVTGTNGKTTVVSMIEHILNDLNRKCIACGNNGIPPLTINNENYEFIILELSSYQLEYMKNFDSFISLLINISPDHLERHGNFEEYFQIKKKIFNDAEICIINMQLKDNLHTKNALYYGYNSVKNHCYINNQYIKNLEVTNNEISYDNIKLSYKGTHTLQNILSVLSVIDKLEIKLDLALKSLRSFQSLPHRIEKIISSNNIRWYNDSKSTNCESTIAALNYLEKNIILIIGGSNKIIDYEKLSYEINKSVKIIIFVGENKEILKKELNINIKYEDADDYESAVNLAVSYAISGDSVILSPASPSFDMFSSFEQRGETFKKVVKNIVS